jgi:type I restriction enzyme R subunit
VQTEAIHNLELSLADNRPRALIQMATGARKTFIAVSSSYRLIKFAQAKRILFLVDRNNLGRQTLTEFQQYASPYTGIRMACGRRFLRITILSPDAVRDETRRPVSRVRWTSW